MRCSICLFENRKAAIRCGSCGARLNEPKHQELFGIQYMLGQLTRWEQENLCPPDVVARLREKYSELRDAVKEDLAGRSALEKAVTTIREPKPAPAEAELRIIEEIPCPPPPPAPKPPFLWKNLLTERNIRWILNLGIFIFSIALAVFIQTQWKGMPPAFKIMILFGASFTTMAAGHFLRRTILKATGLALVALGSIAVPIDFAAIVKFGLVDAAHSDAIGLGGSILSFALYVALAWFYRETIFTYLATLAATSFWAFVLRRAGVDWQAVAPWIAPFALACLVVGRRPVRLVSTWILVGSLLLSFGLLQVGLLSVRADVLTLEIALASAVAAAGIARLRWPHKLCAWAGMLLLCAMFVVAMGHFGLLFRDCWLWLALLGAAFGMGWRMRSIPFIVGSVVAGSLGLMATELRDLAWVAWALAIPGALHAAYGFEWKEKRHALAGWLLLGLAMVAALYAAEIDPLHHPLAYAAFGVLMVVLGRREPRETFHALATLGAGAAMFLLAVWYPQYYRFKPAPSGLTTQILGVAIALMSALAFGPLANRLRSRFVSDITYGCIGFAWILTLRWAGVPPQWLGLSIALFGTGYVVLEKRVSRWLLRPTLFTGIACTVAAGVFACMQWMVWREYLQASLTLLLVGAFYHGVAHFTQHRWLAHVGTYVATAGWWVGMEFLRVPTEWRGFLTLLPAGAAMVAAGGWRRQHVGGSALVVAMASLAFIYLDPRMYEMAHLPISILASLVAALIAGAFAFGFRELKGVDRRLVSGIMGLFASVGYILWLKYMSTGSPWGGLSVFAMSALLVGAGELLRRVGFEKQSWPLVAVSFLTTCAAIFLAHDRGTVQGVHLWVYGLALALYAAAGWTFQRPGFSWAGAAAGAAGLIFWLQYWEQFRWIGVWTFPFAALAFQKRDRALFALGAFAAVVCPLHAAWWLRDVPQAGLIFVAMTALLALTHLRALSYGTMALGGAISFIHEPWNSVVLFSGFALYLVMGIVQRRPRIIYVALVLALLGDFTLAMQFPAHRGLVALPLAFVLFGMAYEAAKRFGREFGWPLLGASLAAAALSTTLAYTQPTDRIIVFLGDALLAGAAAALFRRPELIYVCSAALVALDLSIAHRFGLRPTQMAFQLLTLALAKIIFVRSFGERIRAYLQPVFVMSLLVAAGVLAFGFYEHRAYTAPQDINYGIWGLMLTAATAGLAGRIRKMPALLYVAAVNLLGAYYLTLHKYQMTTLELYTVPIGIGIVIWSALVLREKGLRVLIEVLAVAILFVPSAVQSFLPGKNEHSLAALGLAFLIVLTGMGMRRRALLFGGTGVFIAEVLGKALQYLIERQTSFAEWGMILGGLIILVAAAFESRKALFVQDGVARLRAGAGKYFGAWE